MAAFSARGGLLSTAWCCSMTEKIPVSGWVPGQPPGFIYVHIEYITYVSNLTGAEN